MTSAVSWSVGSGMYWIANCSLSQWKAFVAVAIAINMMCAVLHVASYMPMSYS